MVSLSELITAKPRFAKSANVERDASSAAPLDGYVLTPRGGEVLDRVLGAIAKRQGGAWAIVGPYGSGKSSIGLLLDAILQDEDSVAGIASRALLAEQAPEIIHIRNQFDDVARGFVTAANESLADTVLRAVTAAAVSHFGKMPTNRQLPGCEILTDQTLGRLPHIAAPSPSSIVKLVRTLAERTPVVLLIDEFGKNIESSIVGGNSNDPYLLQQLAELGQGVNPLPVYLITLQHLSFEDYLSDTTADKEWAKVQGRFEDIAFVEAPSQTRTLIASVFDADVSIKSRVTKWAKQQAELCTSIGLPDLADAELLGRCYPLHPIAVALLPELCGRYGQNERTLYSFLAGTSAFALPALLSSIEVTKTQTVPTVGLSAVFDFFVGAQSTAQLVGPHAARWMEISTRFRDVQGLSDAEQRDLKAIAVLNLVSAGGSLRASRKVVEALCVSTIDSLSKRGLLTWRDFSDEFRIWHGTDFDLPSALARARGQVQGESTAALLDRFAPITAVIAARHSSENETVRVFERKYLDAQSAPPVVPSAHQPVDGLLLYWVDSKSAPSELLYSADDKPVVVAIPSSREHLRNAVVEAAALFSLRSDERVLADWVAEREVSERFAFASSELMTRIDTAFSPQHGCEFLMINGELRPLKKGRGSAAISEAADMAFNKTPRIPNEVINRHEPSSQGARARRELLEAMLTASSKQDLGLEGFGPEKAIYLAVLASSGIHRFDKSIDQFVIGSPDKDSPLRAAWNKIESAFEGAKTKRLNLNDLYTELQSRPFGMKAGAIPILVTAVLISTRDEVAIYEHGTFKPILSADVSERMVRNPAHFEVKHFAAHSGLRSDLVDAYAQALSIGPTQSRQRVSRVLRVVSHLVARMNTLPDYAKKTANLDTQTLAVRSALSAAVEPDVLLFDSLPTALGFPAITAKSRSDADPNSIAAALLSALTHLENAYPALVQRIIQSVHDETGSKTQNILLGQAESIAGLALKPQLKALTTAFLGLAKMESPEHWAEYVGNVVNQKQPSVWGDDDERTFTRELQAQCAQFRRVAHLHVEVNAESNIGFSVRRVVFTDPDGGEDVRIAALDDQHRGEAERILLGALSELEGVVGSTAKARDALLVVVGDRLTAQESNAPDFSVIPLRDDDLTKEPKTKKRSGNG